MGLTIATLNAALDSQNFPTASLHSGDPGSNGANELTGGTYARKSITFGAASGGVRTAVSNPVFDVPAGGSVRYAGFWDGATFKGSGILTTETYTNAGTYTLTAATITLT